MLARPVRRSSPGYFAPTAPLRQSQPRRSSPWNSAGLAVLLLFLAAVAGLPGCTRSFYRVRADRDVDQLLVTKTDDPRWPLINYYIYPSPYARFADLTGRPDHPPMPPDDPAAWLLSPKPQRAKQIFNGEGLGYLELLAQFDEFNRGEAAKATAAQPRPEKVPAAPPAKPGEPPVMPKPEAFPAPASREAEELGAGGCPAAIAFTGNRFGRETPFLITLDQALELSVINSREFQNRREQLYLTALPVTLQRFSFMPQFQATSDFFRRWAASESPFGKTDDLVINSNVGYSQLFETGALLVLRLANQTTIDFAENGRPTLSQSTKILELSQPFLQGGGKAVTLEPLTQVERNLLYDIRDFAHFNSEFYVAVASGRGTSFGRSGYLQALLTEAFLDSARRNEKEFTNLFERYQAFVAGGIQSQLQVDQIEQNYLNAKLNVLSAEVQLKNNLDSFKFFLGVPPDLPLELDDTPLQPIKEQIDRFEHLTTDYRQMVKEMELLRDKPGLSRTLRQEILKLFTEAVFTRGTQFAATVQREWPTWQRAPDQELQNRLRELRLERESLRVEEEKLRGNYQELPPEKKRRLRFVEGAIQFGGLEETVRAYEREPWKQLGLPALQERQRRELFRAVVFRFTLLIEVARFERLNAIQQGWPDLPPVRLHGFDVSAMPEDEAQNLTAQTALINRLDLMNQRARVVDAWRQIAVTANSLLGTFDVRYNLEVLTPPPQVAQPLNFDGNRARHQLIVNTELPLVRRIERNQYRAALIAFQRSRRDLMEAEDIVVQQLRQTVRSLRQLQENYKIQQRDLQLAYSNVDQALEAQFAPADPRRVSGDAGSAAALTDQVIRAQQNIPRAQNALYTTWVNFLSTRMEFYRDLELMQINTRGVWINDFTRPVARPAGQP